MLGYVGSLLAIHLVTTPPFRGGPIHPSTVASEKCADPLSNCTSRVALSKGNGAAWVVPLGSKVLASGISQGSAIGSSKWKGEVWTCSSYSRGVFGLLKMKKPALRGVRILRVRFFLKENFVFFLFGVWMESYMDVFFDGNVWMLMSRSFRPFFEGDGWKCWTYPQTFWL